MSTNPRRFHGSIAGPGGPHDRGAVIVDTTDAVLLETCTVSTAEQNNGESVIAMLLGGRINRSKDRAEVLFLMGSDGPAAIISELIALLGRAGSVHADALLADLIDRVTKLRAEGNLSP